MHLQHRHVVFYPRGVKNIERISRWGWHTPWSWRERGRFVMIITLIASWKLSRVNFNQFYSLVCLILLQHLSCQAQFCMSELFQLRQQRCCCCWGEGQQDMDTGAGRHQLTAFPHRHWAKLPVGTFVLSNTCPWHPDTNPLVTSVLLFLQPLVVQVLPKCSCGLGLLQRAFPVREVMP